MMSLSVAPLSPLVSSKITSRRWAVPIPKRRFTGVARIVERRDYCASSFAFTFSRLSSSMLLKAASPDDVIQESESRATEKGEGEGEGEGEGFVEMILLLGLGIWTMGLGLGLGLGSGDAAVALGFGEGPVMEEFWENMRRYGLYFFTVGTGALYTILRPIYDLFFNSPASALFTILIISAFFYLLYLVLTAMIGLSDFSYQYAT